MGMQHEFGRGHFSSPISTSAAYCRTPTPYGYRRETHGYPPPWCVRQRPYCARRSRSCARRRGSVSISARARGTLPPNSAISFSESAMTFFFVAIEPDGQIYKVDFHETIQSRAPVACSIAVQSPITFNRQPFTLAGALRHDRTFLNFRLCRSEHSSQAGTVPNMNPRLGTQHFFRPTGFPRGNRSSTLSNCNRRCARSC